MGFSIAKHVAAVGIALVVSIGSSANAQSTNNAWDGGYIGLQAGYGMGDADWALNGNGWWGVANPANNGTSFSTDGFVGGIHGGYGMTNQNNMYWGIDAEFNFADLSESKPSPAFPGIDTWLVEVGSIWNVSGRLGTVRNNTLFYASAGIAGADVESLATPPFDQAKELHIGYTLGLGGEYLINPNMSLGVNYKYYDFGSENHPFNAACGPCGPGDGRRVSLETHVLSLRLSTRF